MIWAQMMPFVALGWYEGENKEQLQTLLFVCFGLWLVLNGLFFFLIEKSYITTFFGTKTAPQYTVELFRNSEDDASKFDAAFDNRLSYLAECEEEVKGWIAQNYDILVGEEWFIVAKVPDDFLSKQILGELNELAISEGKSGREKMEATTLSSMKEIIITLSTVDLIR